MPTALCVSFNIECAHTIEQPIGVPVLHGHSYMVKVCVGSQHTQPEPLPAIQGWADLIKHQLDHKNLNDVLTWMPTMEAIIWHVREKWGGPPLVAVSVTRPTIGASAEWAA